LICCIYLESNSFFWWHSWYFSSSIECSNWIFCLFRSNFWISNSCSSIFRLLLDWFSNNICCRFCSDFHN